MVENEILYTVLWVEDTADIEDEHQLMADDHAIILDRVPNWHEAEAKLRKNFNSYSAIILDALCNIEPGETAPKEEFLNTVLPSLNLIFGERRQVLPWYIYSQGIGIDAFEMIIKGANMQRSKMIMEWGPTLFRKNVPDIIKDKDDKEILNPECFHSLCAHIADNAKRMPNNIVMYRHIDVIGRLGEGNIVPYNLARSYMQHMLGAMYYPEIERFIGFQYEGNPLRRVVECLFRTALSKGLLPEEFFSNGRVNLEWSKRLLSGEVVYPCFPKQEESYRLLCDGAPVKAFSERGADFLRSILYFASSESHTSEDVYLIDETQKELFFSYVLQLCYVIKEFTNFIAGICRLGAIQVVHIIEEPVSESKDDYLNQEYEVEEDENGNFHCGGCRLPFNQAKSLKGLKVKLIEIVDSNEQYKNLFPFFARKFELVDSTVQNDGTNND